MDLAQFVLSYTRMQAQKGHATTLLERSDHLAAPPQPAKAVILVVDDDELHRVMMRRLLHRAGFAVLEARNGEHAYRQLSESADALPALVIVDGHMPVMDGWELVLKLQGDARLAALPVIMVSGAESGSREGLSEFFQKPFDPSCLMTAVRRYTEPSASAVRTH